MKDYYEHQCEAIAELREHVLNCKHGSIYVHDRYQEADLMVEGLIEEGQQIRFLDSGVLKIKWESPCAWVGCAWHLYYCKLAKDIEFKEIQEILP